MSSANIEDLHTQYEQVKSLDQAKNSLIEDLLQRVLELEKAYQQIHLDHKRETHFNRELQVHEMELMERISRMTKIMEQEPFILVLIDGDGMVFDDSFLRQGEQGGKDAANQLWALVREYAATNLSNLQSPKIAARIYANVKGLADVCYKAGIVDRPSLIEDFTRGFNGSRLLFDFVDVGSGKDRADDKISELFKLNLYDCHCRHVMLGCSHDNGYARLLEETIADHNLSGRISLIEGVKFERELATMKGSYRVTKFEGLFRDNKIVVPPKIAGDTTADWGATTRTAIRTTSATSNTLITQTSAAANPNGGVVAAAPSTWAATTAAAASADLTDLTISKPSTPVPPMVERNKYGQRIDRVDYRAIPKDELNRVKKLKLCNLFYLLGECPNLNCYHTHDYKLGKNERVVLQAVARMTPCHFGTECDDAGCIYGHRCPLSEIGRKDCYWGANCRFDTAAHGIDTNIVKTTKV